MHYFNRGIPFIGFGVIVYGSVATVEQVYLLAVIPDFSFGRISRIYW